MAVLTIPTPNHRTAIQQQIEIQEPGPHENLGATRIGAATHGARPKGELRDWGVRGVEERTHRHGDACSTTATERSRGGADDQEKRRGTGEGDRRGLV
jgi:hypothetical protein